MRQLPLRVPRGFVARMRSGDPADPLLRQVLPYYLHLLDRVQGAAHFEVGEGAARDLVSRLAAELPGYLVPRLVRERPGAPAKVPL